MKKYFIYFLIFLIVYFTSLLLSSSHFCDPCNPLSMASYFYNIQEGTRGIYHVFFKNVRVHYEVTSTPFPGNSSLRNFHFKQINPLIPPSDLVTKTRASDDVTNAVMEHFNDIQRGRIHSDLRNQFNANPHSEGIYTPEQVADITPTPSTNTNTNTGTNTNTNTNTNTGAITNLIANNNNNNNNTNDSINSPLDQFSIIKILDFTLNILNNAKFTITNMSLYILISAYISWYLNFISVNIKKIVSNLWSSTQESIYFTIHSIVVSQINSVIGQKFFAFIYVIFIYILISNLIGMVPYNFSSTAHFILTFFLSFTVVLGSTLLGLYRYKFAFFSVFVPSGCPATLIPLLVFIELISYLARNISLGLRLAANVLSGHMLLNILSGFSFNILKSNIKNLLFGLVPMIFVMAFSALEIAICFIQAQVFSVLSSSYIRDGVVLH